MRTNNCPSYLKLIPWVFKEKVYIVSMPSSMNKNLKNGDFLWYQSGLSSWRSFSCGFYHKKGCPTMQTLLMSFHICCAFASKLFLSFMHLYLVTHLVSTLWYMALPSFVKFLVPVVNNMLPCLVTLTMNYS